MKLLAAGFPLSQCHLKSEPEDGRSLFVTLNLVMNVKGRNEITNQRIDYDHLAYDMEELAVRMNQFLKCNYFCFI